MTAPARRTSTKTATPYASVVLPCYNEEDHVLEEIARIVAAFDASGLSYEVLAVDDGSTDGTREILMQAEQTFTHVRCLPLPRNGGMGTALRIGTSAARGEVVLWTDADLSYPNERLPEFATFLADNPSVDQIVGARTTEEGTMKLLRVPAKWLIRKIASRLVQTDIPDLNSGMRCFRKEVSQPYLRLLPPGFSAVTTITLSFMSNQHIVQYVPIDYAKRGGASKFHPLRDAYRYILQVLRMVMYFNPIKVLMPLALILLAIGLLKLPVDLVRLDLKVAVSTLLLLVTGFQVGALALIADLVVRSRGSS